MKETLINHVTPTNANMVLAVRASFSNRISWFDIETSSGISKMQKAIKEHCGIVPESVWEDVFDIVEKYYRTWDERVAVQSNADIQYSPCMFVWYVNIIKNIPLVRPIDVMRVVYKDFRHVI